jgi:predicted ABC-type ATPase
VRVKDLPDGEFDNAARLDERGKIRADLPSRLSALEPGHPSAAADCRRLTDAQYAEHVRAVDATLADWRTSYRGTEYQHTMDQSHKVWSAERAARHDEIIQHLYGQAADVPCEGWAILAGGLPGSGKTTVLTTLAGVDRSRFVVINPDEIKEQLADREMVPAINGLSPMEATDLAHEESSFIARQLGLRAYADRKNLIWDITMSRTESTQQRIGELEAAGYIRLDGIFVAVPVEVSLGRAKARHRKEHDAYRAGDGLGGRYIPPGLILANANPEYGSVNRLTFEQIKQDLHSWRVFDNSVDGRDAILAEAADNQGRERTL